MLYITALKYISGLEGVKIKLNDNEFNWLDFYL